MLRTGFVDTTRGAVLTSMEALAIAKRKADNDEKKREADRVAQSRRETRLAVQQTLRDKRRNREFELICARRASLACMPVRLFKARLRSMKERRAGARMNAVQRARGRRAARIASARVLDTPLCLLANVACENA